MATLEQYANRPNEVDVFAVGSSYTDVILRKDITEVVNPATSTPDGQTTEETTVWRCEERQLRVPRVLTADEVAADFDTWWVYTGSTQVAAVQQPTNTERIAALEAAVLELGEVLANG